MYFLMRPEAQTNDYINQIKEIITIPFGNDITLFFSKAQNTAQKVCECAEKVLPLHKNQIIVQ